jgi:hypothetical protein
MEQEPESVLEELPFKEASPPPQIPDLPKDEVKSLIKDPLVCDEIANIDRNAKSPEVKKIKAKQNRKIKSISPKKLRKVDAVDKENSPEVVPARLSPFKPTCTNNHQGLKLI